MKVDTKHQDILDWKTSGDSGYDLKAESIVKVYQEGVPIFETLKHAIQRNFEMSGEHTFEKNTSVIFSTGIKMQYLEPGYELQIRPRSGASLEGVDVALGTIDSNFRGELGVICRFHFPVTIKKGQRIAQLVCAKICKPEIEITKKEHKTERGAKGFGSSGK